MYRSFKMVRDQAKRMTQMIKEKALQAHPEKSSILVLGSKAYKDRMIEEIKRQLILLSNFPLKIKDEDKYLGQTIGSNLATSAVNTLKERYGKIKGAAMEVKQIIEDFQMQALGGLAAARDLWERALVHSLLACSGTWLGDIQEAVKLCDYIEGFYWKIILKVPDSCPKLAIRCEAKMRSTKWRIWEEKCLLLLWTTKNQTTSWDKKIT